MLNCGLFVLALWMCQSGRADSSWLFHCASRNLILVHPWNPRLDLDVMHPSHPNVATTNNWSIIDDESLANARRLISDMKALFCVCSSLQIRRPGDCVRLGGFGFPWHWADNGDKCPRSWLLYCLQIRKPVRNCVVIFGVEDRIVTEEMAAWFKWFIALICAGSNEGIPERAALARVLMRARCCTRWCW